MKPANNATAAPDWFHNRVVEGLQFLLALGLEGTPAAEVIRLTATAWVHALWEAAPVAWQEAPDSGRLYRAFNDLAVKSHRWPSPKAVLEHMRPRPEAAALPPPRAQLSAEMRARLRQLGARRRSDPAPDPATPGDAR